MDDTFVLSIYTIENGGWVKQSVGTFQVEQEGSGEDTEYRFTNCKWDEKSMELVEFFETLAEKIDVENLVQIDE